MFVGSSSIDEEELSNLLQHLMNSLGKPFLPSQRMGLVEEVRNTMKKFDTNNDGVLNFQEFARMLTMAPWRNLFPKDVQHGLRGPHGLVVVKHVLPEASHVVDAPVAVPLRPRIRRRFA